MIGRVLLRAFGIRDEPAPEPKQRCSECGRPLVWNVAFSDPLDQALDAYQRGWIEADAYERAVERELARRG